MKTALSIAGSDSSGGAGIQADLKTMTMNGVFAMTAVTALTCRDRRYGVLSQVVVRDRYQDWTETVDTPSFQALGGQRRQVITMPGKGQYQAMRYSGQFQLEQSAAEQLRLEVEVPKLFFAKPGDLVQLAQPDWGRNGQYRVAQAQVGQDEQGAWTRLELAPPNMVL